MEPIHAFCSLNSSENPLAVVLNYILSEYSNNDSGSK